MSDEQIIALLTEMRDLQKQQVENQKLIMQQAHQEADFQKQRMADLQNRIAARQRVVIMTVIAVTIIAFLIVTLSSQMFKVMR